MRYRRAVFPQITTGRNIPYGSIEGKVLGLDSYRAIGVTPRTSDIARMVNPLRPRQDSDEGEVPLAQGRVRREGR